MTNQNRTDDRDTVLFAFHQACSRPTADQIIEWTDRYPQFAEDIRAHAAVTWDWVAMEGKAPAEADDSLIAETYSRALNIIWHASDAASAKGTAPVRSFQEIMAERGTSVPQVARRIGIKRGIVGDLVSGRMSGPIKNVFVGAFSGALHIARDAFEAAHARALAAPTLGPAKADHAPSIIVRTYEEIIRTSDELTDEEKRHWLEED
jgi:hypothetical protein